MSKTIKKPGMIENTRPGFLKFVKEVYCNLLTTIANLDF